MELGKNWILIAVLLMVGIASASTTSKAPNFVLNLADDQGWNAPTWQST